VKAAILDVFVTTPGCVRTELVDVTVRCPHSIRLDHGTSTAATLPSAAARDGELGKLLRYGPQVMPLAFETYGRLGRQSADRLKQLVATVSSTSVRSCFRDGGALLSAVRRNLERALLFNIADVTLLSLGHTGGFHAARHRRREGQTERNGEIGPG